MNSMLAAPGAPGVAGALGVWGTPLRAITSTSRGMAVRNVASSSAFPTSASRTASASPRASITCAASLIAARRARSGPASLSKSDRPGRLGGARRQSQDSQYLAHRNLLVSTTVLLRLVDRVDRFRNVGIALGDGVQDVLLRAFRLALERRADRCAARVTSVSFDFAVSRLCDCCFTLSASWALAPMRLPVFSSRFLVANWTALLAVSSFVCAVVSSLCEVVTRARFLIVSGVSADAATAAEAALAAST